MTSKTETTTRFARLMAPVGELLLVTEAEDGLSLRGIYFARAPHAANALPPGAIEDATGLRQASRQLEEYFAGERTAFAIALQPRGTAFQLAVWRALAEIPYGTTTTYATLARSIGRPRAIRAVGAANGQNPLSIVVPCHRVIGHDGSLTGYAGGMANKRLLLDLEAKTIAASVRARARHAIDTVQSV
jgi:methylated-DNA-[protein]-cysteine S-methyltransferase